MALFTYPFCYVPRPEVRDAARALTGRIDANPSLRGLFSEGKMMGTLVCEEGTLYAFSGLAGGCSRLEGFVGPIFDYTDPDGYFRKREAEISAMPAGVAKSEASARLQDWLFSQYEVGNFKGERATIKEVYGMTANQKSSSGNNHKGSLCRAWNCAARRDRGVCRSETASGGTPSRVDTSFYGGVLVW